MQLEHSEFQDQIVRGLAHRMNNILTLFHGYLGMLMDNQKLDQQTRSGLAKIKDGACAATNLMDRTHALVRPPSAHWREVKLADFLPMLQPSFDALCGPKTTVTIECRPEVPAIWADATRIKQAIFEIVRNAIEASFAGGEVRITLAPTETPAHAPNAAGSWIAITITDNGPGIPEEIRERIYEPYFSTKKKVHATGLGLTVAAEFIKEMGGLLRCESEPGRTTFEILLPTRAEAN